MKIIGIIKTGDDTNFEIKENECIKTFTGELINDDFDIIVPVENVEVKNNKINIIKK